MRLRSEDTEIEGPNLTPVLDIVFLLIIFFIVATTFEKKEKLLSLQLAEVFKAEPVAAGARPLIINVNKKGEYIIKMAKDLDKKDQYLLKDEKINERNLIQLLETIAAKSPNTRVQVRADQDVQFKFPLTVIGICKENELDYSCTVMEKQTG
ncbi:MAG: biopolymer transporter ExbD [Planctomycetota bacterium]|nr:biopolymer transporter ExbD [Planctomycetota bacterium]